MNTPTMLELRGVSKRFGGLMAVNQLDLHVGQGSIHGLIGPNGAGKSTAFDLVSGLQPVTEGVVHLQGQDITHLPVQSRVRQGICRTFQTPKLFEKMTALEVVKTGRHIHARCGFFASTFGWRRKAEDEARVREAAVRLLTRVGLEQDVDMPVATMSYGKRRLVEIARALATEPKLLLLDEVASGLNPVETAAVGALIRSLAADGLTIVVVEHDMPFVMGMCDQISVLNFGSKIAAGTPADIAATPAVVEAYLGRPDTTRVAYRDQRKLQAGQAAGQHPTH